MWRAVVSLPVAAQALASLQAPYLQRRTLETAPQRSQPACAACKSTYTPESACGYVGNATHVRRVAGEMYFVFKQWFQCWKRSFDYGPASTDRAPKNSYAEPR